MEDRADLVTSLASSSAQGGINGSDPVPCPSERPTGPELGGGARDAITATHPASPRTTTTLFVSNLHCPSCASSIEEALGTLEPKPISFGFSFIFHSVEVVHDPALSAQALAAALEAIGFDVHSAFRETLNTREKGSEEIAFRGKQTKSADWERSLDTAVHQWRDIWRPKGDGEPEDLEQRQKQKHVQHCTDCQQVFSDAMRANDALPSVHLQRADTGVVDHDSKSQYSIEINEDGKPSHHCDTALVRSAGAVDEKGESFVAVESVDSVLTYEAQVAIVGMTCASCVAAITEALEENAWIRSVNVALLTNSAHIIFEGKDRAGEVIETIENAGFDATLETLKEVKPTASNQKAGKLASTNADVWKAQYAIGGMTCASCVAAVTESVRELPCVESVDINLLSNSGTVVFRGEQHLQAVGQAIEDAGFDVTLDSVVNLGEEEEESSQRTVSIRIDGIFCPQCPLRIVDALQTTYRGNVDIEDACTVQKPILTLRYTPHAPEFTLRHLIHFISDLNPAFSSSIHHPPNIEDRAREIQARERRNLLLRLALAVSVAVPAFIIGIVCMNFLKPGSPTREFMMQPMWIGSVGRSTWALFILATPVYFLCADTFHRKAIKEVKVMWKPGSRTPFLKRFYRFGSMNMLMSLGTSVAYFSSIAELGIAASRKPYDGGMVADGTYFDSVIFLTMFLLGGRYLEAYSKARTGDAVRELGKLRPTEALLIEQGEVGDRKISVDLLEIGDIVRVPHGSSPPFDGTLLDAHAAFDESSLTGESRLVSKAVGATVYSGTVNKRGPVRIRISNVSGSSMLDQIIKVVREGQTKRAPVERVADIITGHFVPFVVLVGIVTWFVWLALGLSGSLPKAYLDTNLGGWPLWALRFAIAVFVIACPCGIGLAAPTALFVGGGIAAQHGILVKGGGEAFQEASTLNCVVFDKTGTLTEGGNPSVTDYERISKDEESEMLACIRALEENSSHPIAKSIVGFCEEKSSIKLHAIDPQEIAGKGLKAGFKLTAGDEKSDDTIIAIDMIIGNEALMSDHNVAIEPEYASKIQLWKQQGKSVALVASRGAGSHSWGLSALFSISDALRPEASAVVRALQDRGVAVWMLSGDNQTTATAVGAMVGIPPDNIIAGVLPEEKAEKIKYLQKTLPTPKGKTHATVAMVGDGINDSPALTMADVGIAIGSGSDVAISSASFILVSSNLNSLLTLIDLSRIVFRRVWFNFGWALVYNVLAMPVAAGVLYPVISHGQHVRLDPVWAALAMALSSCSVVSSSLLLRSPIPGVGFRVKE